MNLSTVIKNLKQTIYSKEQYLKELSALATKLSWENSAGGSMQDIATRSTIEFLQINIDELKRILTDVEQCVPKEQTNPYHNADSGLYGPEYQGQ
jgi:prefoldin subunit 5